jgi:hypothetical protein
MEHELNLPPAVYYIVGAVLLTNIGTMCSIFYATLKGAWWLSKLDSRVTESKSYAIRAHKRLDEHIAEMHE